MLSVDAIYYVFGWICSCLLPVVLPIGLSSSLVILDSIYTTVVDDTVLVLAFTNVVVDCKRRRKRRYSL
jgi:hypothetical protein